MSETVGIAAGHPCCLTNARSASLACSSMAATRQRRQSRRGRWCMAGRLFVWTEDGGCSSMAAARHTCADRIAGRAFAAAWLPHAILALTALPDEHSRQHGCRTPKTAIISLPGHFWRTRCSRGRCEMRSAVRRGGGRVAGTRHPALTRLPDEHSRQHGCRTPKTAIISLPGHFWRTRCSRGRCEMRSAVRRGAAHAILY
jgi:hypothetical protein